jgi:hypothetical protein
MNTEEKLYRAETCQAPLGETGDYDSWIELVTPNFNLQCYDPNVETEEVKELAEMLNKSSEMETAIKEVLELFDGNGVPNIEWVKNRLSEAVK